MFKPQSLPMTMLASLLCFAASSIFAQSPSFPLRETPRPQTTNGVPHVQLGIQPDQNLIDELVRRVTEFPGVKVGPTRVSLPGAIGFQLLEELALARPEVIVGGREFAHVHPDGSLHASLDPDVARTAVETGWATPHPWATVRDGWEGFVMLYTPTSEDELEVVFRLVQGSYTFVTGRSLID